MERGGWQQQFWCGIRNNCRWEIEGGGENERMREGGERER